MCEIMRKINTMPISQNDGKDIFEAVSQCHENRLSGTWSRLVPQAINPTA